MTVFEREEVNILIRKFEELYHESPKNTKSIYSLYGIKNIGKTFLLNIVEQKINAEYQSDVLKISLNENNNSFKDILLNLRIQIKDKCPLFDYVYYLYTDLFKPVYLSPSKNFSKEIEENFAEFFLKLVLNLIEKSNIPVAVLKCLPSNKLLKSIKNYNVKKELEREIKYLCSNKIEINPVDNLEELFIPLLIEDI